MKSHHMRAELFNLNVSAKKKKIYLLGGRYKEREIYRGRNRKGTRKKGKEGGNGSK